jgi:hypothetical protein
MEDNRKKALAAALGRQQEADQRFQKALLLPDRMLAYHYFRIMEILGRYSSMRIMPSLG